MPSELPKELIQARLDFGARLSTTRRDVKGWSLEDMRTALRETYGHEISRERLRQIERDATFDPDNETVRYMAELLSLEVPEGLKRPAAKKAPGADGAPPRIALARAKKELNDNEGLGENVKQGMRLRIARIEKGLTQQGLVKAVNAELPPGTKPIRVGFVSEAERGVPSLPASAIDALETILGLSGDDLSLVTNDDGENPLVALHDPLTTLVLAGESWISGATVNPGLAEVVRRSAARVREALQAVAA